MQYIFMYIWGICMKWKTFDGDDYGRNQLCDFVNQNKLKTLAITEKYTYGVGNWTYTLFYEDGAKQ